MKNKNAGWFWKALGFTGLVIVGAQMEKDQRELDELRNKTDENSFEYLSEESMRLMSFSFFDEDSMFYDIYKSMRNDFLTLKNRSRSNKENLKVIMKDWIDWCEATSNAESAYTDEDFATNPEERSGYQETLSKEIAKAKAIEKKFMNYLGDSSEVSRTYRINKWKISNYSK